MFSTVKIMCNGLNTTARYRNTAHGGLLLDCKFCWHIGGDNLRHFLVCPQLRLALEDVFGNLRLPVTVEQGIAFFCWIDKPSFLETSARAILADFIVKAYQEIEESMNFLTLRRRIRSSITARISHWIRGGRSGYTQGLDFLRSSARRHAAL